VTPVHGQAVLLESLAFLWVRRDWQPQAANLAAPTEKHRGGSPKLVEVVGWLAAGEPAHHFHKKEVSAAGGMGRRLRSYKTSQEFQASEKNLHL